MSRLNDFDLGLNRIRLEITSGSENPTDCMFPWRAVWFLSNEIYSLNNLNAFAGLLGDGSDRDRRLYVPSNLEGLGIYVSGRHGRFSHDRAKLA